MTTDTLAESLVAPVTPGDLDGPAVSALSRRDTRLQRRGRARSRRSLAVAVLVTAGIPTALLISLWQNLTMAFWYNEQWRAYYISKPGDWWAALKGDGAPFPAGWYFLERVSASLFGSTELVLRMTTALFLPLTCVLLLLLARRWMPLAAAVVVGVVGGLTGTLVIFAVQLSEYQIDAAAVVAILLLHDIAAEQDQGDWRSVRIYLPYAGIALACIFSTPAVFVAAPVLLLDAIRAARARSIGPRLVSAAGAGAIALLHLELFVVPQNALTKSNFWDPQFLPHHGVGTQVAFVWDGLRGFVTGTFTGSDMPYLPELLSPRWSWIPSVAFGVLLCIGIAVAARSERGRTLLAAIGGSIGLTLIASYLRYWPFGFVRTNFYLVPLLILLAGIGAVSATSFLLKRIGVLRQRAVTGSARTVVAVALVVLLALVMTGVGLAATYEVGSYEQLRDSGSPNGYGYAIGAAVVSMKHQANPGAALVVAGNMAIPGWEYYQYEYSGRATQGGHQIGTGNAEFALNHGSPAITSLVRRTSPRQVFLYTPLGTSPADIASDIEAVAAGAPCTAVGQTSFTSSGLLILMTCSHG